MEQWSLCNPPEIPDNKLHSANLDKNGVIQMNWLIDWPNEEVFFYIKNAFDVATDQDLFYLGFSQRGKLPKSDVCLFQLQPAGEDNHAEDVVMVSA